MSDERHIVLRAALKLVAPAALLLAANLAASGAALAGGFFAAIALSAHALIFGPAATRAAAPEGLLKLAMGAGVLLLLGAAMAEWRGFDAPAWIERVGLFAVSAAAGTLCFLALAGRAHDLSDEDW